MSEVQMPATAGGSVALESDPIVEQTVGEQAGGTDTPETVAETDEQKNARELEERKQRSERATRGVQKRFDELTRDKHEARAQAEEARRQAEWLRQQLERQQQRPQQESSGPPKRDGYSDYEQYLSDLADWKAEQKAVAVVEKRLAEADQRAREQAQRQQADHFAENLAREIRAKGDAFAKDVPDYYDVVKDNDVFIPNAAAAAIMTHRDAPALMYALGKNPALAESLQGLSPVAQQVAIGELAASLKRTPQVSKAPPPGTPAGSRSGGPKDPKSMSPDEYYAYITKGRGSKK